MDDKQESLIRGKNVNIEEENFVIFLELTPLIKELIKIILSYNYEPHIMGTLDFVIGHGPINSDKRIYPLLKRPLGIATDGDRIYICSNGNGNIISIDKEGNQILSWRDSKIDRNSDDCPCIAAVHESKIYVTNSTREIIIYNTTNGTFIKKIICHDDCWGITIYESKIYVSLYNIGIGVYTLDGILLKTIKCELPYLFSVPDKQRFTPYNLCVNNDEIYVTVFQGFNVICMSIDGKYKFTIRSEMQSPSIHITDYSIYMSGINGICQYDKTGKFLRKISIGDNCTVEGIAFLSDKCYMTSFEKECIYVIG